GGTGGSGGGGWGVGEDRRGVGGSTGTDRERCLQRHAKRSGRRVEQFLDGHIGSRRYVIWARPSLAIEGEEHNFDEVVDVHEVAARIHDEAGFPGRESLVERGQGAAEIAGAVRVG